jgi:hypothetical protein
MSVQLGNGSITFSDGTVQSTKTPTVTSAFTNDSGYVTSSSVASTYATIAQAGYNWSWSGYYMYINTYNVDGGLVASQSFNCNCNC